MKENIIEKVHRLFIKKKKTVAVAESCTGGLLSQMLTRLSGSSRYFVLGVVSYSNQAKEIILRIPPHLISLHGAVSPAVAKRMAKNVRKIARTEVGIAITGIAGPTGGTPSKPIGTIFISIDSKNKNICEKFNFQGSRTGIRKKAALKGLELLKKELRNL
jgi:nicotinamide-nucleotide amidase